MTTKIYSFFDCDRFEKEQNSERKKDEQKSEQKERDSKNAFTLWYEKTSSEANHNKRLTQEFEARWEVRHEKWNREENYEPTPFGGAVDDTALVNRETLLMAPATKIYHNDNDFYNNLGLRGENYWIRLEKLNGDWVTTKDYASLLEPGEGDLATRNIARDKWKYQIKYDYSQQMCDWLKLTPRQTEMMLALHMRFAGKTASDHGSSFEVTAFCAATFVVELDDSRFYSPGKIPRDGNGERREPDELFSDIAAMVIENEKRKRKDRQYSINRLQSDYKRFRLSFQQDGAMIMTDGGQIMPDKAYFDGKVAKEIHEAPIDEHENDWSISAWSSEGDEYILY